MSKSFLVRIEKMLSGANQVREHYVSAARKENKQTIAMHNSFINTVAHK